MTTEKRANLENYLKRHNFEIRRQKGEDDGERTGWTYAGYHDGQKIFDANEFLLSNDIDISDFTGPQVVELRHDYDFVYDLFEDYCRDGGGSNWINQ